MKSVEDELFELRDIKYKEFHSRLMPTVDRERIIGVRTPVLRKYAKGLAGSDRKKEFMSELPHYYYEENNVHAFIIETIKEFDAAVYETEKFLPFVDNWATCDAFAPKIFEKNKEKIIKKAEQWIKSDSIYTVRYGIGVFMRYFLDDEFKNEYLDMIANIKSDEYYVNMMRAWYFATALAKQYKSTVLYIENNKLDDWTHNKLIQKAIESNRISIDVKTYLRTLRKRSR